MPPVADAIAATAGAATAIYLASLPSTGDCSDVENGQCGMLDGLFYLGAALVLIPTAIYTGAAVVGFKRTGRCREALAEYDRALRAQAARTAGTDARVLLVAALGSSRSHLERVLLALEIDYDWLTPREFDRRVASGSNLRYPVIILVDHDPRALPPPPVNLLAFRAGGRHAPFRVRQRLPLVRIDQVKRDHPALRGVGLIGPDLETVSALAVDPTKGEVALAAAGPHVVIAARSSVHGRTIACGFDPEESSWARSAAFASFVRAAVDWLATAPPTRRPSSPAALPSGTR